MNNSFTLRVVVIALIIVVALLSYLQYQSMQRETKLYTTLEVLQMHVESLDDLHRIQQIEIDSVKKSLESSPLSEATENISSGIETMLNALESKITAIRNELNKEES